MEEEELDLAKIKLEVRLSMRIIGYLQICKELLPKLIQSKSLRVALKGKKVCSTQLPSFCRQLIFSISPYLFQNHSKQVSLTTLLIIYLLHGRKSFSRIS